MLQVHHRHLSASPAPPPPPMQERSAAILLHHCLSAWGRLAIATSFHRFKLLTHALAGWSQQAAAATQEPLSGEEESEEAGSGTEDGGVWAASSDGVRAAGSCSVDDGGNHDTSGAAWGKDEEREGESPPPPKGGSPADDAGSSAALAAAVAAIDAALHSANSALGGQQQQEAFEAESQALGLAGVQHPQQPQGPRLPQQHLPVSAGAAACSLAMAASSRGPHPHPRPHPHLHLHPTPDIDAALASASNALAAIEMDMGLSDGGSDSGNKGGQAGSLPEMHPARTTAGPSTSGASLPLAVASASSTSSLEAYLQHEGMAAGPAAWGSTPQGAGAGDTDQGVPLAVPGPPAQIRECQEAGRLHTTHAVTLEGHEQGQMQEQQPQCSPLVHMDQQQLAALLLSIKDDGGWVSGGERRRQQRTSSSSREDSMQGLASSVSELLLQAGCCDDGLKAAGGDELLGSSNAPPTAAGQAMLSMASGSLPVLSPTCSSDSGSSGGQDTLFRYASLPPPPPLRPSLALSPRPDANTPARRMTPHRLPPAVTMPSIASLQGAGAGLGGGPDASNELQRRPRESSPMRRAPPMQAQTPRQAAAGTPGLHSGGGVKGGLKDMSNGKLLTLLEADLRWFDRVMMDDDGAGTQGGGAGGEVEGQATRDGEGLGGDISRGRETARHGTQAPTTAMRSPRVSSLADEAQGAAWQGRRDTCVAGDGSMGGRSAAAGRLSLDAAGSEGSCVYQEDAGEDVDVEEGVQCSGVTDECGYRTYEVDSECISRVRADEGEETTRWRAAAHGGEGQSGEVGGRANIPDLGLGLGPDDDDDLCVPTGMTHTAVSKNSSRLEDASSGGRDLGGQPRQTLPQQLPQGQQQLWPGAATSRLVSSSGGMSEAEVKLLLHIHQCLMVHGAGGHPSMSPARRSWEAAAVGGGQARAGGGGEGGASAAVPLHLALQNLMHWDEDGGGEVVE